MLISLSLSRGLKPVDTLYAEDFMDDGTPIRLRLTIDRSQVKPPNTFCALNITYNVRWQKMNK